MNEFYYRKCFVLSLASGLLDDDHSLPPLALNEDGLDISSVSASEQAGFSNSATTSISDSTASQIRAASSVPFFHQLLFLSLLFLHIMQSMLRD